jgi:hypothetical protein
MEKHGRLKVLSFETPLIDKSGHKRKIVKCICKCGNIKTFRYSDLKSGRTKSCGCLCKEVVTKHDDGRKERQHHYLYQTWHSMIKRCYNIKSKPYKDYGGRGIKVYTEWQNYDNFKEYILKNLGERPKNCSLDRINNDGNYEPSNCRWATKLIQNQNRRK